MCTGVLVHWPDYHDLNHQKKQLTAHRIVLVPALRASALTAFRGVLILPAIMAHTFQRELDFSTSQTFRQYTGSRVHSITVMERQAPVQQR